MKLTLGAALLGLTLSSGAFAQTVDGSLAIVLSPTITVLQLLDSTTGSVFATSGTGTLASMGSTVGTIEAKGANAMKQMHHEAIQAADMLAQGQEVALADFKVLSAAVNELKNSEEASLELAELANAKEVSVEAAALSVILAVTEK